MIDIGLDDDMVDVKTLKSQLNNIDIIPLDVANHLNIEQHFNNLSDLHQRRIRLVLRLMRESDPREQALLLMAFLEDFQSTVPQRQEVADFDCKRHPIVLLSKGLALFYFC